MRIFFAFVVLWLGLNNSVEAQDLTSTQWFENLFAGKRKTKSAEEVLRILRSNQLVAAESHDSEAEARAMIELASFHMVERKEYGDALDWLMKALILEDNLKLNREKIFTFIAIAKVFEEVNDFKQSSEFLDQSYKLTPKEDAELFILILDERGRVNTKLGHVDEATLDYEQMLKYSRIIESKDKEGDAWFRLGQLQGNNKDYENALKNHKQALAIRRSTRNKIKEAQSLNSVGKLYLQMKNYERSKANHDVALKIRQQLKDSLGMAESYNNMGRLYIDQKNYKQAIKNIELALKISLDIQAMDQTLNAYEQLSLCYKELGDFNSALNYSERLSGISDMLQNEKQNDQLAEVQSRYAIEQREDKIGKLAADMAQREKVIEEQKQQRNFLVLIIGLGAIIGVLGLYLYFVIRKSNRKLKEINETKDKLFSIIGHDLKGPLNSLTAFSSLLIHHAETLTKEEIKMLSGDVDKSLKNLFTLLENLLEWARSQTGSIDFAPAQFDLTAILNETNELLKVQAQKKNITIINASEGTLMVYAHRHSINTVVRNLVSNAIKFTPTGGEIILSAKQIDKLVRVSILDNGVGIGKEAVKKLFKVGTKHSTLGTEQEKGTGLGLMLCKDFVERNGGTIGVESIEAKGSKFYFTVPIG